MSQMVIYSEEELAVPAYHGTRYAHSAILASVSASDKLLISPRFPLTSTAWKHGTCVYRARCEKACKLVEGTIPVNIHYDVRANI